MSKVRIDVDHVSKYFRLPHEKHTSLKQAVINFGKSSYETFKVLDDVSFQVYDGEFFGILGRNGSGKSTMLKLLAGIYETTHGAIRIDGELTPFIELGVGFNAELTGRENVFLNGAILGLTTKQVEHKYDDIVAFAELERFMDQKLKNYSSGMVVRLAFAIAIQAHNAILLVDEVLAVGDERFQEKCLKVFAEIKKDPSRTVIFISHGMAAVQRFCDRAMVIHDGKVVYIGDTDKAVLEYKKLNFPDSVVNDQDISNLPLSIEVRDKTGKPTNLFEFNDTAYIHIKWDEDLRIKNLGVSLLRDDSTYMFGANTILDQAIIKGREAVYELKLSIGGGHYHLQVGFFGETDADRVYDINNGPELTVSSPVTWQGATYLTHTWSN